MSARRRVSGSSWRWWGGGLRCGRTERARGGPVAAPQQHRYAGDHAGRRRHEPEARADHAATGEPRLRGSRERFPARGGALATCCGCRSRRGRAAGARPFERDPLEQRRERRLAGGPHEGERQPREHEHDVRAEEVRIRMPAVGQEQHQVEQEADDGRRAREEPGRDEQADCDLHQRDAHSGQARVRDRERAQQKAAGSAVGEPAQLRTDVGRGAGMQKAGIAQLLDAAIDERQAEEQPDGEQRPAEPLGICLGAATVIAPAPRDRTGAIGLVRRWRARHGHVSGVSTQLL